MRIAFYLADHHGSIVDARDIENGNPGIGGAQYCMLLLAHYLNERNYQVFIIAHRVYELEDGLELMYEHDSCGVIRRAEDIGAEILVIKNFVDQNLATDIRASNLNVVVWSHNFFYSKFADFISKTPQVKANVFVGKQQYDNYIDDDVIKKSITIFNMFPDNNVALDGISREKSVVFMGVIAPGKGFYEMARIWKGIVRDVPDAILYVMGNGSLYGEQKLGRLGIAEDKFEKSLEPFICDSEGNVLSSIKFLGIVGGGKNSIFEKSLVGVINPSKCRETFGMGVLEMAAVGLPVATIAKTGYYDTIVNGETGILCDSLAQLQKSIIELLSSNESAECLGRNAKLFIRKFSPDAIVDEWISLFDSIHSNTLNISYSSPAKPYNSQFKWLRICNRFIRFNMKFSLFPSTLRLESFVRKMLSHKF